MTKKEKARLEALKAKTDLSPEEQAELASLQAKAEAEAGDPAQNTEDFDTTVNTSFDTEGAQHVVTMRGGKAVKVWFKDGKEIGVE